MSNIYEALRRAKLESAKSGEAPPAATAQPAAETGAPTAANAVHALPDDAPLAPQAPTPPPGERPLAAAPRTSRPAAAVPVAPFTPAPPALLHETHVIATPQIDAAFDPANIPQYAWDPSIHQLPALEERGAAVEQFRSLRSRLQQFRDLNPLKSILVSSGLPREGKSFVAANLAISFARHKASRVLLIDGDMRRATLFKMLGAPEGPGLTEYLSGHATLAGILQRPKPTADGHPLPLGLASLSFIPGGHAGDKAADLSGNRRFDRLIAEAAPHFDWIVVDSSPVNLVSDGVNLARSCDGVLLVARGGTTKYPVAQRALAELKASKVLGFVLNAVEGQPVAGGYYGYDGYDKPKV